MRQRIEKQQETKPSKAVVTVMFDDRRRVLGGNESFRARENAAQSLPGELAVSSDAVSDASSPPGPLTWVPQPHPSRDRTRSRSLSQAEKYSAEKPMAFSALAVSAACPNICSPQAAATVITPMTEQRRCAAA